MSITNRLKKLESEVINDSTVCACYPQFRTELWRADLSVDSDSAEPQLMGEPVPEVCPNCSKPTQKERITLRFCDSSTPERFPQERGENNKEK
jgi:hypothetical protein